MGSYGHVRAVVIIMQDPPSHPRLSTPHLDPGHPTPWVSRHVMVPHDHVMRDGARPLDLYADQACLFFVCVKSTQPA